MVGFCRCNGVGVSFICVGLQPLLLPRNSILNVEPRKLDMEHHYPHLGSSVVSFFCWVPLSKPNRSNEGTLIIKELLRKLVMFHGTRLEDPVGYGSNLLEHSVNLPGS